MKKQIIKIISMVLVFVIATLVLSSCQLIDSFMDSHKVQQRPENEMYGAVKVLYSYDDTMAALDIVRERVEVDDRYTVRDMGEDYTILYYFIQEGAWTEYPIDYETYFTTVSYGFFTTKIFFNDRMCPGHDSYDRCVWSNLLINKFDEDYEKLNEYRSHAGVRILDHKATVEIDDPALLSYRLYDSSDGAAYVVYYEDTTLFKLYSCIELDEEFFEDFFANLVTTRTVK